MPRPGLPLVHFNDRCCGSVAELRSIILTARRLVDDHAEQERAAAAAKTRLLAQIEKKRAAPAAPPAETRPDERFIPSRLAASGRSRSPRGHPTSCGYQRGRLDGRAPAVFPMYQAIDRNSR